MLGNWGNKSHWILLKHGCSWLATKWKTAPAWSSQPNALSIEFTRLLHALFFATMQCVHYDSPFPIWFNRFVTLIISCFEMKSLFKMFLIKKNVQWTFSTKPNGRASFVRGHWFTGLKNGFTTLPMINWSSMHGSGSFWPHRDHKNKIQYKPQPLSIDTNRSG